jgi:hypothetical protein
MHSPMSLPRYSTATTAALRLRVNAHKLVEYPQEAAACFQRFAERLQQLHKEQGELRRGVL